jgi:hypothetical protein
VFAPSPSSHTKVALCGAPDDLSVLEVRETGASECQCGPKRIQLSNIAAPVGPAEAGRVELRTEIR